MPTRKQRRRREKGRRHEYEYYYVDDEGREIEGDAPEEEPARPARKEASRGARASKSSRTGGRAGRVVQPPSWRRVGKRGLIFAPLMFIMVSILSPDFTSAQRIYQTLFLLVVFLPFSYVMDSMTYRMWRRRISAAEGSSERRKGG